MQMIPRISIKTNKTEIAKYIYFLAKSIQIGKYSKGDYLLLPYIIKGSSKVVYFPKFKYSQNFWETLSKQSDYSLTVKYPKKALDEVAKNLVNYNEPDVTKLKKEFEINWKKFIKIGDSVLDFSDFLKNISSITVLLTEFGTLGSFSRSNISKGKFQIYITSRIDFPWQNIYEALLQAFILITQPGISNDVGTIGWHQRNAIRTYLLEHSAFKKFLEYTTELTPINPKNILESIKFQQLLGFPPQAYFDKDKLLLSLTIQEKNLFRLLWERQGLLVSFDEAAGAIWGNQTDIKFSLYSLAKLVENIRKKLRGFGINKELIFTLRKQGYILIYS